MISSSTLALEELCSPQAIPTRLHQRKNPEASVGIIPIDTSEFPTNETRLLCVLPIDGRRLVLREVYVSVGLLEDEFASDTV